MSFRNLRSIFGRKQTSKRLSISTTAPRSTAAVPETPVGPLVLSDTTTDGNTGVDIVLVHSLRGHALSSWSTRDAVCWPRDLLREDLNEASLESRVVTWGYDASVADFFSITSSKSIFGLATTLLEDLIKLQRGKARPIIFVAHSLGGLVVKEALIRSATYKNHDRHRNLGDIYQSTTAVIFLGTPHRDGEKARLGEVVNKIARYSDQKPQGQVIQALSQDSRIFDHQTDQFALISNDIPVLCVREGAPTRIGTVPGREGWTSALDVSQICIDQLVPDQSSSYDGARVTQDSIIAGHMDMIRFKRREGTGYRKIRDHIFRLIHQARYSQNELKKGRDQKLSSEVASSTFSISQNHESFGRQSPSATSERSFQRPDRRQALISMRELASALYDQGKHGEAETICRKVQQRQEKLLGPLHEDILTTMHSLGSMLYSQEKYEDAEELYWRLLQRHEKLLGAEHPDTLLSMDRLGSMLYAQRKNPEAEVIYRQVLQGRERVLGPQHPDTLDSMNWVNSTLQNQGKYEEAEEMFRQVLKEHRVAGN